MKTIKIKTALQINENPDLIDLVNNDEWKHFDLIEIAGMSFELMVELPDCYYGNLIDDCVMDGDFVIVPKTLCEVVV